jgi:hypothetical protein
VLLGDRAIRIASKLGMPDAKSADSCLNCHAWNLPPDRRGPHFNISDGVGCGACHGGGASWIGVHLSGASHKANLAAGLYPTENPGARAELCLTCHYGSSERVVSRKMIEAGHPRLSFELDTYSSMRIS